MGTEQLRVLTKNPSVVKSQSQRLRKMMLDMGYETCAVWFRQLVRHDTIVTKSPRLPFTFSLDLPVTVSPCLTHVEES